MCALSLTALGLTARVTAARAEHKVALVVGNNHYVHLDAGRQLEKAINDAHAVAGALRQDGFTVLEGTDLTRAETVDKLYEMSAALQPGDTALFYFAGHGVALGSGNYLLPSDVPDIDQGQEMRLASQSVAEADVIATLQDKGARITLMILDACRDNPFRKPGLRSVGLERGFGRMPEATGVYSLYSAGYGQSALDSLSGGDADPNSVFTRVLVPLLTKPGLNLDDLAFELRENVTKLAATTSDHHVQTPAAYNQIVGGRVYLAGAAPAASTMAAPSPATPPQPSPPPPQVVAAVPAGAATPPPTPETPTTDAAMLAELRDRLFEQGYDPGAAGSPNLAQAVKAYASATGLPQDAAMPSLVRSLRGAPSLAPWGAMTFSGAARRWGMAYGASTRQTALRDAHARCGVETCAAEITFHNGSCGAFALSSGGWSMTWRSSAGTARQGALAECGAHGPACRIVGAVCADGSERVPPGPSHGEQP